MKTVRISASNAEDARRLFCLGPAVKTLRNNPDQAADIGCAHGPFCAFFPRPAPEPARVNGATEIHPTSGCRLDRPGAAEPRLQKVRREVRTNFSFCCIPVVYSVPRPPSLFSPFYMNTIFSHSSFTGKFGHSTDVKVFSIFRFCTQQRSHSHSCWQCKEER